MLTNKYLLSTWYAKYTSIMTLLFLMIKISNPARATSSIHIKQSF